MKTDKTNLTEKMSIFKIAAFIFIPTTVLMAAYIFMGYTQTAIPSLLLFFLLAIILLFSFEIGVVLKASKKAYGKYSLKSAFNNYEKMSAWKVFMYGSLLFAFAGIMSITVAPLENSLFAPLSNKLTQIMPKYFNWNNIEYLKQYPKAILLVTCVGYSICNVIIGPIIEELFFRGYLTSKLSRLGNFAPLIITVLFSLYHFWLPFNNLFRICAFFPAAWLAWKKKNIYIAIAFHCLCNLISTVGFIVSV
ncbi:MAG: CPBP family intramembrane glutamic endopeptidase [Oscillospiraceae bacterium]